MKRLVVLMALVALIVGGVWAIKSLPWWALLAGAVALVPVSKWALQRALMGLFIAPFKMKGAALKGASAEVHSVMPTTVPTSEEASEESNGHGPGAARRYFWLDVTVRPTGRSEGFQYWEPGELRLVTPESRLNPDGSEEDEGEDACEVTRLEVQQEGAFEEDEGWKMPGPQRLRLLLAVSPGVSALKFRYYFEEFGDVRLPAEGLRRAA